MTEAPKVGCTRPASGPVEAEEAANPSAEIQPEKEVQNMIQVGKAMVDFTAPAYHQGEFTSVKLSSHLGKWVVLCFYPGDFTFV